jgi:hypothetical protein
MPFDSVNFKVEADVVVEPWRKVLLDAAALLERDGWCDLNGDHGRCVGQSIWHTVGSLEQSEAEDRFLKYLGLRAPREMFDWNDAPGRTASEVIQALRDCAKSS